MTSVGATRLFLLKTGLHPYCFVEDALLEMDMQDLNIARGRTGEPPLSMDDGCHHSALYPCTVKCATATPAACCPLDCWDWEVLHL